MAPTDDDRRLADELRVLVRSGGLAPDGRLPSIRELATRYNASKAAVEQALRELRDHGLIESRRGSGNFVRTFRAIPRVSPSRLAAERWQGGEAIQDADTEGRWRTVDVRTGYGPVPEWAATPLRLKAGDRAAFRSRRYEVEERPVQMSVSWLPVELASGTPIMHTETGPGGTYARLREAGHAPVAFTEFVRARMPEVEESRELALPAGTPVVEVTRHAFTSAGRCVEVNRMVLDGMAYLLEYHFDA